MCIISVEWKRRPQVWLLSRSGPETEPFIRIQEQKYETGWLHLLNIPVTTGHAHQE